MPPLFLLGALAAGAWLLKSQVKPKAKSTPESMIDASELYAANAPNAVWQITSAIATNDPKTINATADVLGNQLKMPKTAANLRAWATMIQGQSTTSVSGESGGRVPLPDWLKFQATMSKLSGDPGHIRATAETMKRFGYRRAAEIHLKQV